MPTKKRVYWDACVFISYFDKTPSRIVTIDDLLAQSKSGDLEIVTSTLSIVEVAFNIAERTAGLIPQVVADMDAFWRDTDVVTLIEPSVPIARQARSLIRYAMDNKLKKIRCPDATHLASAQNTGCVEIHSYNFADFDYLKGHTGIPAMDPYLTQTSLGLPPAPPPGTGGTT